jgi:hypothetical protein
VNENAMGDGGTATGATNASASVCAAVGEGEATEDGGGGFAAVEEKAASQVLAVEDAQGRVIACRAQGDGFAAEGEVVIAGAGVGSIRDDHHIAIGSGVDARLNGRLVGRDMNVGGQQGRLSRSQQERAQSEQDAQ